MQLTQFTDIGLRVLMYLSQLPSDARTTIDQVATALNVPRNHLTKVVARLATLGWVNSLRGRNGGLCLGRPAAEIMLGTVLRQLEETHSLVDCHASPCDLRAGCRLRSELDRALEAFYHALDPVSLEDVISPTTRQLLQRLQIVHSP